MKTGITKEDFDTLCDLVFLGNYIVNSHQLYDRYITKYSNLIRKIEKLHRHILSPDEKKRFDNDEMQFYLDRLEEHLDKYKEGIFFYTLVEKLAKVKYPENPNALKYYDSIYMQLDAQDIYLKELTDKGINIINIDIPDMDDKLEERRKERKL